MTGIFVAALGSLNLESGFAQVIYAHDPSGNLVSKSSSGLIAPQIVGQPQRQVVAPGQTARFSVVLADTRGVSYQWRFNNNPIAGATSDTLVLGNVTVSNEGLYSVFVSNSAGNATSASASLFLDTDFDSLPDSWEQTNFGNLASNAVGDIDNDGISNLDEFRDGTNPNSNASFRPRLTIISDGGGVVNVTPAKASYNLGEVVTLTAAATAPNTFRGWSGALSTQTSPATLTMNASRTVKGHFISTPIPAGVVSWWRAENNASDAIGNNPGALVNGLSFATGEVGQAFNFSASNQHVKVNASPTLNVGSGIGLTIEAWIKPADLLERIIAEWNNGSSWGAHFGVNTAFGGQGGPGCLYANIVDTNNVAHYFFSPTGLLNTTAWQHVALTYDRISGSAKMFLNGAVVASVNLGSFVPQTTLDLYLGYRPTSTTLTYSGLMDEPALYNRALTVDEIFAIHAGGPAGKNATPYFTSPSQLPDAALATAYSQQLSATLGTAPLTYTLGASGALPPGLSLSAAGLITGTPTTPGASFFSARVTDAAGRSSEQTFGLKVTAPIPPPAGTVAWWRAQNNAQDSIGTNHGTLQNGATYTTGKVGQAFNFNGSNQYVLVPNSATLQPQTLTLDAWVFPRTVGDFNDSLGGIIFTKDRGSVPGSQVSYALFGPGNTGRFTASVQFTDGTSMTLQSVNAYAFNQWYHVAMTWNGNTLNLYVNGSLAASATASGPTTIIYTSDSAAIGRHSFAARSSDSVIDGVTINHRALAATEVAAIFSAGPAGRTTAGPIINTPSPLPDGNLGQVYSQPMTALRTTGATTWSVTNGALPPGLSLSAAGLLTGTPTAIGTSTFTVRLTDATALIAEQVFTLAVYAAQPPAAGLVSWWRAENNPNDAIGSNHGTLTNGATFATGRIGQAFALDGGNDYVNVPDSASLQPTSITLEGWFNFSSSGGNPHLISRTIGTGFYNSFVIWLNSGILRAGIGDSAGNGNGVGVPFSPVAGRWYHIAFTFDDSTKQAALYLDGSLLATNVSSASSASIGYDNHPVLLGGDIDFGNPTSFFHGRIDEAALYSRALSAAEVASIFNAGSFGRTVTGPYFNTPPALPDALVAAPYSHTVTTLRGTAPVTFSVVGGALPPGLTLNSSGLLSGTPTTAGLFSFTVRATDANSLKADLAMTLQVLPRVAPPAGIISWWRAQSNAQDSIAANHGTLTNGTAFAAGKAGTAFSFDGVDDLVTVPTINAGTKYTVEFWLFPRRSVGYEHLVSYHGGGGNYGDLYFRDNHIEYWQGTVLRASSPVSSVPLFTWSHIALTFDGLNLIYVNGVPLAMSVPHGETFSNPLAFGYTNAPSNNRLLGLLDEIALYNRALSSSEIAALYSAGSAGKTIAGPYISTPPQLPDATVGLSYSHLFTSLRGSGQVTYALVGGSLPLGLVLNSNGTLSGTPTNAGISSFTIRATDAAGLVADQSVTLRISSRSRISLGAVSWWRADANAQDSVGTNHGTLVNGPGFASGKVGQAFKLDGTNDHISIPDAPSLRPTSFTVEGWFSFDNPNGIKIFFAKPISGGILDSYAVWLQDGFLRTVISDAAGSGPVLLHPFVPIPGRWYHIAFTFDGPTKQQILYLDTAVVAIGLGTKLPGYDSSPLVLGADIDNGTTGFFHQGGIDEVAFYNRVLRADEIASVYQASAAGKRFFFPVENWKLANVGDPGASDTSDGDFDTVPLLVEYAFGLNPTVRNVTAQPQVTQFNYPEGRRLRIIFPRDPAKNDITIEVQASGDLTNPANWTTIASSVNGAPTSGPGYYTGDSAGAGIKQVEVRDIVNMSSASQRYVRIRVTQTGP